jgi:hypothetical protein
MEKIKIKGSTIISCSVDNVVSPNSYRGILTSVYTYNKNQNDTF